MEINQSKLNLYLQTGWHDRNWYLETENLLVSIFGRDKLKLVASYFAATSINSSLKSNIRLFRRALHEVENSLPHVKYLPVMRMQLDKLRNGQPLSGRKIRNFAEAMSGNSEAVVVDIWLARAFAIEKKYFRKESQTIRSGGVSDKDYTAVEQQVKIIAASLGIQPRQASAVLWSGIRIATTGDRNTRYHSLLQQQLYNMFDEVPGTQRQANSLQLFYSFGKTSTGCIVWSKF